MIIVAGISVGIAAYGWQSPPMASFDSNLNDFLQRTNSSLLIVSRLQDTQAAPKHFDEYSLGSSNAALYRYLNAVDGAYENSPSPGDEPQAAKLEVVISQSESRTIFRQISPALQESTIDFDVYGADLEVEGKLYSIVMMVPN